MNYTVWLTQTAKIKIKVVNFAPFFALAKAKTILVRLFPFYVVDWNYVCITEGSATWAATKLFYRMQKQTISALKLG